MTSQHRYRLVAFAAFAIVVGALSTSGAQQQPAAGNQCQDATKSGVLTGTVYPPAPPGQELAVLVYPRSSLGERYLAFLKTSTATPAPVTNVGNLADRLKSLQDQGNYQLDLEQQLPGLFASMYGTVADFRGHFTCGGLPPGSYRILFMVQPNPSAPPVTATASGSINAQAAAQASAMAQPGAGANNSLNAQAAAQAKAMAAQMAAGQRGSGVNGTTSQYRFSSATINYVFPIPKNPVPVVVRKVKPISQYYGIGS